MCNKRSLLILCSYKLKMFPPQNHIESLQTDPARRLACSFQCMHVIEKIGGTEMHAGGMKEGMRCYNRTYIGVCGN